MSGNDDAMQTAQVDFYFDAVCPFAWITSRWILEVRKYRPIEVRFRVMSLALLNEGKEQSAEYAETMRQAKRIARVCIAAEQLRGESILEPLYGALGRRLHNEKRRDYDAVLGEALAEAGLPSDLLSGADGEQYDAALAESHRRGMEKVGDDVGTPTLHIEGTGIFGPVFSRIPRGEEAARLFDATVTLMRHRTFYELKRSRTEPLVFD